MLSWSIYHNIWDYAHRPLKQNPSMFPWLNFYVVQFNKMAAVDNHLIAEFHPLLWKVSRPIHWISRSWQVAWPPKLLECNVILVSCSHWLLLQTCQKNNYKGTNYSTWINLTDSGRGFSDGVWQSIFPDPVLHFLTRHALPLLLFVFLRV